jgi:peptidyl-dipeptidase Dcp
VSGTSVARDFVELPSQIMENWVLEPEVLAQYARHYQTGDVIPDELVAKIERAKTFNTGYDTCEYLAASYLDMDWHTLREADDIDPAAFEQQTLERIGLPSAIPVRYRSPYFQHIFGPGGGYSAGYYSYLWAEVLDADAFAAFKETSLFDQATAEAFRNNVLARGGSAEPMELYVRFRGAEPAPEPMMQRKGLLAGSTQGE